MYYYLVADKRVRIYGSMIHYIEDIVFIGVSIRACCERSMIWEGYLDKTLLSTINFYLVDYVQLIYFDLKNKNGSLKKSIYLHELDI